MNKRIFVAFTASAVVIVAGAYTMFLIESPNEGAQIGNLLDAFWWAANTATTVGYGDVVPVTPQGRILGMFMGFVGIIVLGTFFSVVQTALREGGQERAVGIAEETKMLIKRKIDGLEDLKQEDLDTLIDLVKSLHGRLQNHSKSGSDEGKHKTG